MDSTKDTKIILYEIKKNGTYTNNGQILPTFVENAVNEIPYPSNYIPITSIGADVTYDEKTGYINGAKLFIAVPYVSEGDIEEIMSNGNQRRTNCERLSKREWMWLAIIPCVMIAILGLVVLVFFGTGSMIDGRDGRIRPVGSHTTRATYLLNVSNDGKMWDRTEKAH